MKDTKTKHPDSHFVGHETPPHEPVPVDGDHAEVVEAHGAIAHEFTKPQVVRKHEQGEGEPDLGGEDKRNVKASRVTLGRHISSDPGMMWLFYLPQILTVLAITSANRSPYLIRLMLFFYLKLSCYVWINI